ncbi:PhnD/SsuA/transferrin family substrate-binding protein [Rhizobium lusitanum]|uniref:PhnD/SsuA/transferrin family substrate-binding protein n=1 Tax=Rhizobium lusitanum TaxID=293958 RepID=A0A6L9UE47_9HYPH|nr:ABC transporter substrate-binding protein [Rhizobium lusitanum]NEI72416.1 PhnD/SsuA/transferrin family substrate-binding protein [Rhizobium lusitanum]
MKSKNRLWIFVAVAALSAATMIADERTASAQEKQTLRIGVQGSLYLPAQSGYAFATDHGSYEKAGLDVQWTKTGTVADCARAIAGGSLDACTVEAFGAVNAVRAVPGLKVVGQLTTKDRHYLVANPSIKSIKDLANQKIGTGEPSSVQTLSGKQLVKALGGNPDDSTWVSIGATVAIIQSFANRQVAAAMVVNPFQLTVKDSVILGDTGQSTPTYQVLLAKPGTDPKVLEGLQRFMQVTLAETDYMINPANEADIEAAWSKWVKVDPDVLKQIYKSYLDENHWAGIKDSKFAINQAQWADVVKLENPNLDAPTYIDESLQKAAFPS